MLRVVLSLRYVMLLASLGAAFGALLMFWEALVKLASGFRHIVSGDTAQQPISAVMGATDAFLFGVVLVIFAYGIAFGFVFQVPEDVRSRLPRWMRIEQISELKQSLIEVILVYLAVDFVTDIAESESHASWPNLVIPLSIFLLAGALRLVSGSHVNQHRVD
ncbi:membrane protein [Alsobacter metallidurans]|uniref:Membrane protein n=1 Tax=Alsobacter metallidurans TaxID=340221 RepID=A0A917IAC3_9HYPH|nr:YqhA family protein [Alsobacter metallidurans]GGH31921.1 membrane protein [Alsobacter metallidurans]